MDTFTLDPKIYAAYKDLHDCTISYQELSYGSWRVEARRFGKSFQHIQRRVQRLITEAISNAPAASRDRQIYIYLKDLMLTQRIARPELFEAFRPNDGYMSVWSYAIERGFTEYDRANADQRCYLFHQEIGCDLTFEQGNITLGVYADQTAFQAAVHDAMLFYGGRIKEI